MEWVGSFAVIMPQLVGGVVHADNNKVYGIHKVEVCAVTLLEPQSESNVVLTHLLQGVVGNSVRAPVAVSLVRGTLALGYVFIRGVPLDFGKPDGSGGLTYNEPKEQFE